MLSAIQNMKLPGVNIDETFGKKDFANSLLNTLMSYRKDDGTFGFANEGDTSGEFTMQAYAAFAAAGRQDEANSILQSAVKAGLVVIDGKNVYVKYTDKNGRNITTGFDVFSIS